LTTEKQRNQKGLGIFGQKITSLIGKKVGEIFKLDESLTDKKDQIQIIAILDNYTKLFHEIRFEAENSNISGLGLRTFSLKSESPEELIKSLIENFGKQGSIIEEENKSAIRWFLQRRKSFSELVIQVFRENPIDAYTYLTQNNFSSFRISPIKVHNLRRQDVNTKFVLDFTSLLPFFFLSEQKELVFPKNL
jgi:hypothetical protein